MAEYVATVSWKISGPDFRKGRYSREHSWEFDGGVIVPASPSPHAVPSPWSNSANVDPEEAYVAAIASCHLLTWLFLASKQGCEVLSYSDRAVGTMTKNAEGRLWVSRVDLHPKIAYGGAALSGEAEAHLHHLAHQECYIANSVKTEISVKSTR